jgi:hypothetical protein
MKKQILGLAAAALMLGSSASQAAFSCDDPLKSSFGQSFCVDVFDSLALGDYKVSFQYQAEKSSGTSDRTLDFGFLFGSQEALPTIHTASDSTATSGWNTYSFIAKAGGDSFLAFSLLGFYPQRFSLALQNIQVTPVPEPASFAMLLAGLGAIMFVSRRRRQS